MTSLPPQIPDDPRGWLTFSELLPDDVQRAEDSTQHHDFRGAGFEWRSQWDDAVGAFVRSFTRPSTDTEKMLLTELGHTVPDELLTQVSFPSPFVRRRRWPQLEETA